MLELLLYLKSKITATDGILLGNAQHSTVKSPVPKAKSELAAVVKLSLLPSNSTEWLFTGAVPTVVNGVFWICVFAVYFGTPFKMFKPWIWPWNCWPPDGWFKLMLISPCE